MLQSAQHIIQSMHDISLEEMDTVMLQNRTDKKYLLSAQQLPSVMGDIAPYYSVLHINGTPFQDYKTVYYDTADNKMYMAHQNGKLNRYKVRHRTYLSTNVEFLEVKYKQQQRADKEETY